MPSPSLVWAGIGLLAASLLTAGCSPTRVVSTLSPTSHLERAPAIAYGTHPRQQLDIYRPNEATAATGSPVVVFFYGGSWQRGDRGKYAFVGSYLADLGVVAVVPDYRVYPEVRFPGFVEDGAAVLAWVEQHIEAFGGDPDQVLVMGHSAGAHIAALLALDERYLLAQGVTRAIPRGLIGLAGPYRFDTDSGRLAEIFAADEGQGDSQPMNFARGDAPPALLLHGENDRVVSAENSRQLFDRLCEAGGTAEVIVYPGVGHMRIAAALAPPLSFAGRSDQDVAAFIARVTGESTDRSAEDAQACGELVSTSAAIESNKLS
ncbi:MAG: alpha/beta hydrolase [Gammaproteobacteria bacterium]|nr:alpha/beta hydrolase [Gammaproteobacteria bacterium]